MNASWARALEALPAPIKRRSYLRHLHFNAGELANLTFKLAETADEREQAFRLLHNMYVRRGLLDPSPSGLKLTVFSLLPTTAIFVGIRDGRVLSTMSLVEDSPLGLPMEDLYADVVERVRARGGRLAEVGALTVARGARSKGLALQMYNLMFRWARFHRSVDDLVIAVHPRVSDFYETLLLFEKIGGERRYSTLKDAPAVALHLDLRPAVARYRKIYGSKADVSDASKPGRNFYRFFCVEEYPNLRLPSRPVGGSLAPLPVFPPSQADAFLEREPIDVGSLTPEQRKYLLRQLPKLKSLPLVEVDFTSRPRVESAPARGSARRRRILFVAEGVSFCHAARPTALAEALASEDYEVVLAREPRFSEIGTGSGIAVRPIHSISSDRFLAALASGSPLYDAETLDAYVAEDLQVIREVAPDAVIGDFRLSLSVSARLAGVPYLALCDPCWSPYARIRFPLADHRWSRIVGSATAQAVFSTVRPLALAYHCRPLNAVRQRYGLSSLGHDLRRVYTDADHTLYADAPGLIPIEGMPSNHHHLGPISDSPATAWPGWWNAVPADRPVVSLTLAFARDDLFSMALEALADLPVTVLVTTGGRQDFASLPNNAFFADYLPAQAVAARSSLAIGDGGTWTCQPPLAAGVPVLGIAGNMNQTINMQAIQRRGAGEMLRASTADSASLRAMVQRMLADPAYTAAAQEVARLYARHHAPTRLAEILEMVFAGSRAVA